MKTLIVDTRDSVMESNRTPRRHLEVKSPHYCTQVLGGLRSLVFGEAHHQQCVAVVATDTFSAASKCVWKLDSEA